MVPQCTFLEFVVATLWRAQTNENQNSLVYVAKDHNCFNPERARRLRKKYGNLQQSEYNDLSEILLERKEEVFKEMLDRTKGWSEAQLKAKKNLNTESSEPPSSMNGYAQSPYAQSPYAQGASAALQYNQELTVRSSPSSPIPLGPGAPLRSPVRMPPVGFFGVTSPQGQGKRSPDKAVGGRSPYLGSPSRRTGPSS